MPNRVETVAPAIDALLPELEALYKDLHQHPELSMQAFRTAALVAVLDPTLRAGLEAMLCAAAAWLGRESEAA
ncbi:hypothetical protein [Paraburkholderia silvatlantica]|uniref:Amidohydrolase n=1 Tax=Paraburkholderia silvatlantica TaxID=321895 RepID=A0A2U1AMX6_9BURK|nr:hypothetical protein [Paraburkholderia silvatlantica]PVY37783.1 hypothetical protein C7411_101400 [Paraburkholderia silvatlantica]PXW42747.1 hypothetical protein C7413_101402 [Paraburkholderia silvatlantica]PYE14865.1 hypothetical protein C7410_13636 [Paraburkholderia silvatlantica]TDR04819.1 hypothetical protein C7412_10164 [Paraburkholderia silvatlantica]